MIPEQRCKPPSNTQIDPHSRILRIGAIHIIALLVGHHLESQFVVITQKQCPLTGRIDFRRLRPDIGKGKSILHPD